MCYAAIPYIVSAVGAVGSAKAQMDQASYDRGVAEYNAGVEENRATSIENKAIVAETEERTKAQQLVSSQRAAAAARGAQVDFGTALDLTEDTELIGEINALRIRETAEDEAAALRESAKLRRAAGAAGETQATTGALSTVFSTAGRLGTQSNIGSVDSKWYSLGQGNG